MYKKTLLFSEKYIMLLQRVLSSGNHLWHFIYIMQGVFIFAHK